MRSSRESTAIPDERISVEQRGDGSIVVRVRSEGPDGGRLPDAVFSFRCGDPQYAYWLGRIGTTAGPLEAAQRNPGADPAVASLSRRRGNSRSAR